MVSATALFYLRKHLCGLRQFVLQKCVGLEKFITLTHGQVKLGSHLIKRSDLGLGLAHLVSTLLAELVVMRSQECDLLKEDMILLSQQVDPFPVAIFTVWTRSVFIRVISGLVWVACTQGLKSSCIGPSLFNELQVLPLFDFKRAGKLVVFAHELPMHVSLLTNSVLQDADVFCQGCNMVFILLHEWADCVSAE